jgi:hypothetical protein
LCVILVAEMKFKDGDMSKDKNRDRDLTRSHEPLLLIRQLKIPWAPY